VSAVLTLAASERPRAEALPAGPEAVVPTKTWVAVIGACLGAFLAILNIQVVSSSLADIQGAIGTGADEGGWIVTAYLVAEIIIIPMSAWLARMLSLRTYLLGSTFFCQQSRADDCSAGLTRAGRWGADSARVLDHHDALAAFQASDRPHHLFGIRHFRPIDRAGDRRLLQ
jgi:hypothetical protein